MSYIPERDGPRERYEAPKVDPWTQMHLDAARRQYEKNLRGVGLAPPQPGGYLDQLSEQADGAWEPRARRDAEGVDQVTGRRVGGWLREMAARMTPEEHPASQGPPQRNVVLEEHRARMLAEQQQRQTAEERARSDDGWLGRTDRQLVAGAEKAALEAAELDLRIAERTEAQRATEWAARRAERQAAAEERHRQLAVEVAAELERERAAREWEERQASRQRWSARARRAEAAALEEAEFGDDWSPWGGDAA